MTPGERRTGMLRAWTAHERERAASRGRLMHLLAIVALWGAAWFAIGWVAESWFMRLVHP